LEEERERELDKKMPEVETFQEIESLASPDKVFKRKALMALDIGKENEGSQTKKRATEKTKPPPLRTKHLSNSKNASLPVKPERRKYQKTNGISSSLSTHTTPKRTNLAQLNGYSSAQLDNLPHNSKQGGNLTPRQQETMIPPISTDDDAAVEGASFLIQMANSPRSYSRPQSHASTPISHPNSRIYSHSSSPLNSRTSSTTSHSDVDSQPNRFQCWSDSSSNSTSNLTPNISCMIVPKINQSYQGKPLLLYFF